MIKIKKIVLRLSDSEEKYSIKSIHEGVIVLHQYLNSSVFIPNFNDTFKYISYKIKENTILEILNSHGYISEQIESRRFSFRFTAEQMFSLSLRQNNGIVIFEIKEDL